MLRTCSAKALALYLVAALLLLSLPSPGWSMFLPADTDAVRSRDGATVQAALESAVVRQRLTDFGLASDEALAKLNGLSNEQLHRLAANIDAVQAGGDAFGAVIFALLVALIVVVVLEATGHHIVIRR